MIYNSENLLDLPNVVEATIGELQAHTKKFDSIVVRGVSGLIVGVPVALALNKPVVVVRKPGESSHDYNLVVNISSIGKRYLFLDDFTATGDTRKECCKQILKAQVNRMVPYPFRALHVADYYYSRYSTPRFKPTNKRRPVPRKVGNVK